jgi:hypothetical protein
VVTNKGNEMFNNDVQDAFDKMKSDLRSTGWSEDLIPAVTFGFAMGVIQGLMNRVQPHDREFFLNMIRTTYDREYLESIGHKSTL